MYRQEPFAQPGLFGNVPYVNGMYTVPPGVQPPQIPPMSQPGMPQPQFPGTQTPQFPGFFKPQGIKPGPTIGDSQFNIDARLERIEREIVEINRRLNNLTRQVRRIENFLNIRENF